MYASVCLQSSCLSLFTQLVNCLLGKFSHFCHKMLLQFCLCNALSDLRIQTDSYSALSDTTGDQELNPVVRIDESP